MPGNPYNGFFTPERRATAVAMKRAAARGDLPSANSCCMCREDRPRYEWHSEDYRTPFKLYSLCRRCHYAVHIRFSKPAYWLALVRTLDPDGWFQALRLDPETLTRPFDLSYPLGLEGARFTLHMGELSSPPRP